MKTVVDFLSSRDIHFKKLEPLNLKEFKIRNKFDAFYGVDLKSFYTIVLKIEQNSRVLQKNVDKYEEIVEIISKAKEHTFKKKIIFIEAPLCSKAKEKLKILKWKVFDGSL